MSDTKITETFEFKTSILKAYDGHEQRIRTRQNPRHLLSYDYSAMNSSEAQWLRAQARARQTDVCHVPMWHNVAYLSTEFYGGNHLYIDPEYMAGFANCDAIEIFVQDDVMHHTGSNITKIVRRYENNAIVLKTSLDRNLHIGNTWILPLVRCSTQPTSGINYVYSNGTEMTMNFEDILYDTGIDIAPQYSYDYDYTDLSGFNDWNIPVTYNNREVFLYSPQWFDDDSLQLSIDKNVNKLDNTTGIFKYDIKGNKTYDSHTMKIVLGRKKMIFNMIKFFKRMGGMHKSFYCPSYVNDFDIVFDTQKGKNTLYTNLDDLYKYYMNNGRVKQIIIFTKDFKCRIYTIMAYGVETIGDKKYGKLLLATPLEDDLRHEDITMTSYFNLVRFDSDELKIDYESNSVATVSLVMKEVDDE